MVHKGQLGLYQVGSPSLGQLVGADDIEKAAVGWDVFRIAKLVDLKVYALTLAHMHYIFTLYCTPTVSHRKAL